MVFRQNVLYEPIKVRTNRFCTSFELVTKDKVALSSKHCIPRWLIQAFLFLVNDFRIKNGWRGTQNYSDVIVECVKHEIIVNKAKRE